MMQIDLDRLVVFWVERDYSKLKGDTGPLVYPAGFLYIYSAIQYVTGGEVYPAQVYMLIFLHKIVLFIGFVELVLIMISGVLKI